MESASCLKDASNIGWHTFGARDYFKAVILKEMSRTYVPRRRAAFELLEYSSPEARGKRRGKRAARGLLSMGRQAQMMAVLDSIVVQIVELSVPYNWSLALDPVLRVVIRKIDVMQTLIAISKIRHELLEGPTSRPRRIQS